MEIKLISKEQFNTISIVQKKYSVLTFQNVGYQYIKETLNAEEIKAKNVVAEILNNHIIGYSEFNNFRLSKKENRLEIRVQYNYGAEDNTRSFTGVGYILLDELLNGFE